MKGYLEVGLYSLYRKRFSRVRETREVLFLKDEGVPRSRGDVSLEVLSPTRELSLSRDNENNYVQGEVCVPRIGVPPPFLLEYVKYTPIHLVVPVVTAELR